MMMTMGAWTFYVKLFILLTFKFPFISQMFCKSLLIKVSTVKICLQFIVFY